MSFRPPLIHLGYKLQEIGGAFVYFKVNTGYSGSCFLSHSLSLSLHPPVSYAVEECLPAIWLCHRLRSRCAWHRASQPCAARLLPTVEVTHLQKPMLPPLHWLSCTCRAKHIERLTLISQLRNRKRFPPLIEGYTLKRKDSQMQKFHKCAVE